MELVHDKSPSLAPAELCVLPRVSGVREDIEDTCWATGKTKYCGFRVLEGGGRGGEDGREVVTRVLW